MSKKAKPSQNIVHPKFHMANDRPFVLMAGVNVIENETLLMNVAESLKRTTETLRIPFIFKASFDKANRTSLKSFRGPGLEQGLKLLSKVKATFDLPLVTDIHEGYQAKAVAEVVDIVQIPAFLARQTDLVVLAAKHAKIVQIKKPQFLAPDDMHNIVHKCMEAGLDQVILCERGSCFGYHNLVVDMLAFPMMRELGICVCFDVTHSLQTPGAQGTSAGGRRQYVTELARAGIATKISALFLETHPDPDKALCDGASAIKLALVPEFLKQMKDLDDLVKSMPDIDSR